MVRLPPDVVRLLLTEVRLPLDVVRLPPDVVRLLLSEVRLPLTVVWLLLDVVRLLFKVRLSLPVVRLSKL